MFVVNANAPSSSQISNEQYNEYPSFNNALLKPSTVSATIRNTALYQNEKLVSPNYLWYNISWNIWSNWKFQFLSFWQIWAWWNTYTWYAVIWYIQLPWWLIIWKNNKLDLKANISSSSWSWSFSWNFSWTMTYTITPWLLHSNGTIDYVNWSITKSFNLSWAWYNYSNYTDYWIIEWTSSWLITVDGDYLIAKVQATFACSDSSRSWTNSTTNVGLDFWYAASTNITDWPRPLEISIN